MTRTLDTGRLSVAFDLCGVLVEWDPRWLYRKLLPDEAAVERFLETVDIEAWDLRNCAGHPISECVRDMVGMFPDDAPLIRAWRDRFMEMIRPLDDTIAVLRELRATGTPLYALSNWGADTFEMSRPHLPFLECFDGTLVSGEVGVLKPDRRIFERFLERFSLESTRVIFIDDQTPNVDAATELGFQAIRYSGVSGLRGDLARLGLLQA